MKKTILLILAILPIVLLVVIAFAGQILSIYQHIPVERVAFVDRYNNEYSDKHTFTLEQGDSKATAIAIYPELASNKNVTYQSSDESICTVNDKGVITGVHYGNTTVIVVTEDSGRKAVLNVKVKADVPYDVSLSKSEHTMIVGEIFQLEAKVDAPVAVNKNVTYTSSNTEVVKVDDTGKITALKEGTAIITVTTISGEKSDTCVVTVLEGELPISFDFDQTDKIREINGIYELSVNTINLAEYLKVGDGYNLEDVVIKIQSGSAATLENGVLTFSRANGLVTIRAYIGDENNPEVLTEIKIVFKGD